MMTNFGYAALGEMLIGLGNALKDPNSDLRQHFRLSAEQLETLLVVIKVAASPSVQEKYIFDLARRWNVSNKTIYNWIELGLVREGRTKAHDARKYWFADEVDEDERRLIQYGYLKPRKGHRMRYFVEMIKGFWNY